MTNLSAGTYTGTVTDNNNCATTASTVVNNFPSDLPAPIISGLPYAGAHLYTITNYNSAYDNYYSWNAIPNSGNAIVTYPNNNKQPANINWPISGGIIVLYLGKKGCQRHTNFVVSSSYHLWPPNPKNTPVLPDQFIFPTTKTITRSEILFDKQLNNTESGISPGLSKSSEVKHSYILYPNPTTGKISLNYNLLSTENGLIEISNTIGVPLYNKKLNPETQHLEIDLSELKPAIYFFKIVVDGKKIRKGMISIIR